MLTGVQIKTQRSIDSGRFYNFCEDVRVVEKGPEPGSLTPRAALFLLYYAGGNMAVPAMH